MPGGPCPATATSWGPRALCACRCAPGRPGVRVYTRVPVCMHVRACVCTRPQPPHAPGAPLLDQGMALLGLRPGPPLQHLVSTWPGGAPAPRMQRGGGFQGTKLTLWGSRCLRALPGAPGARPPQHGAAPQASRHEAGCGGTQTPALSPARPLPAQHGLDSGLRAGEAAGLLALRPREGPPLAAWPVHYTQPQWC